MIMKRWCATSTSPHCWSTDLSRARCLPIFVFFSEILPDCILTTTKTVYLEKHCDLDKLLSGKDEVPNDGLVGRGQASSSARGWQAWEGGLQVEWGDDVFFIFIAALEGHTLVHFGEEIISIMSGTYYIDYSSSVLACTVYLHVLEMI